MQVVRLHLVNLVPTVLGDLQLDNTNRTARRIWDSGISTMEEDSRKLIFWSSMLMEKRGSCTLVERSFNRRLLNRLVWLFLRTDSAEMYKKRFKNMTMMAVTGLKKMRRRKKRVLHSMYWKEWSKAKQSEDTEDSNTFALTGKHEKIAYSIHIETFEAVDRNTIRANTRVFEPRFVNSLKTSAAGRECSSSFAVQNCIHCEPVEHWRKTLPGEDLRQNLVFRVCFAGPTNHIWDATQTYI